MLIRFLFCILALIPFAACSGDDSSSALDEFYDGLTSRSYSAQVSFENGLVHDSVTITFVDSLLRDIYTYRMRPTGQVISGNRYYETDSIDTKAPYIKITMYTSTTDQENKEKMSFSRYASADTYMPSLNIYTAMTAKAVEHYMKLRAVSLDSATALAYENIDNFFGIRQRDYDDPYFRNDENGMRPYIYCRYFISDSIFFSDFRALEDAIDAGEWGDTLFRVRAADELVRYYSKNGWNQVRGIELYNAYNTAGFIMNFRESVFGMKSCSADQAGDTILNPNRRSEFYDSVFVCDVTGDNFMTPRVAHWRLVTPDERKLGYCVSGKETVIEYDSAFYYCAKEGWQQTEDANTIIKYSYKECNMLTVSQVCDLRGTLHICHAYSYIDSTYANMGYVSTRDRYVWANDTAVIDSVYPGGVPDSKITVIGKGEQ